MSSGRMSGVNISSMSIASDIVIAAYNQVELSKPEAWISEHCLVTKALGEVTGTTRLKVRVENPAVSRLDESSDKALSAKHAYKICLLYTSPSPRDRQKSRMPSSA